jgi:S-adenosylmethionine hydrolase
MPIITLTTDYGLKDHYVGSIYGKILTEYPEAVIVSITNNIDPFNTAEANYIVQAAYKNFPKGTVHIIGVDIEKSSENQHIAILFDDHYFICADNGILSLLILDKKVQKMVAINIHEHLINNPNDIDVFIKVACHLAKGGRLHDVGDEIFAIKEVTELQPIIQENSISGFVIYVDHFGNVVTNITKKMFDAVVKNRPFEIVLNQKSLHNKPKIISKIQTKYSDVLQNGFKKLKDAEGEKLAIFNEQGYLEIAIFRSNPMRVGSAKSLLGMDFWDVVKIEFHS